MSEGKRVILFVCIENTCRSQMAEALFNRYAPKGFIAKSAGTSPAKEINPNAIKVMAEVGIDISKNKPKELTSSMINEAYRIINMGCLDKKSCPLILFDKEKIEDWAIEDPSGKPIEKFREVRDKINDKVIELIQRIQE